MKSKDLDWILENRTVPVEVTDMLQELADKHHYSADQMHQYKKEVVQELHFLRKRYIAKYLFPNGIDENERWIHALIRMEIRRLYKINKQR